MPRSLAGLVLALTLLSLGAAASAATDPKGATTGSGSTTPITFTPNVPIPGTFEGAIPVDDKLVAKYIGAFFIYFVGIVGILAVVMVMWGGYHYITSQGNPQKIREGKETITNAIIGLILAFTSILLLRLINPALVSFRGLVPSYIGEQLQTYEKLARPMKTWTPIDMKPANLQTIAQRVRSGGYQNLVRTEGDRMSLGADFKYRLMALLFIESSGNPNAVSGVGACGLIQLMPTTAGVSCEELKKPEVNVKKAAEFYASLVKNPCPSPNKKAPCTKGNVCTTDIMFANAAYNAGRGGNYCSKSCPGQTWWQCADNDGYAETRNYVSKAEATYQWLKANFAF